MDTNRFDRLTRSFSTLLSRRTVAGLLGIGALALPNLGGAKKHHKHKKRITRNAFGCVNVGNFCKHDAQCCSGICRGKKGKKTCHAHDTGDCPAEADDCQGVILKCRTATGDEGLCVRTTGKASYCFSASGDCFPCSRDADCVPFCGAGAACVVCAECAGVGLQTSCVGVGGTECSFA